MSGGEIPPFFYSIIGKQAELFITIGVITTSGNPALIFCGQYLTMQLKDYQIWVAPHDFLAGSSWRCGIKSGRNH
jgi:hypothetical protein